MKSALEKCALIIEFQRNVSCRFCGAAEEKTPKAKSGRLREAYREMSLAARNGFDE